MGNDRVMDDGPATFHRSSFVTEWLVAAKAGRSVSVCVPARNEERTIGRMLSAILQPLGPRGAGLVDEVVVVDDSSTDATGAIARDAGARVLTRSRPAGKGQAMRAGLDGCRGDFIVFLDADVENTSESFVTGLLGPLLSSDEFCLVKGFYERPLHGAPSGGGASPSSSPRPLIELLFPELAPVRQPLAGETAAPRWVLEKVGFAEGYGVELALLVDVARRLGVSSLAQVDLGVRVHRNRPLDQLRPQAVDVLRAALGRAGVSPERFGRLATDT